jgi:hypothetical protein
VLDIDVPGSSKLDEHGDRVPFRLEDSFGDVAQVLAVGLQRQRQIRAHLQPVEVVAAVGVADGLAGGEGEQQWCQGARRHRDRSEKVQPLLEDRFGCRLDRERLQEAIGVHVGDEDEGCASIALHVDGGVEPAAPIEEHARKCRDEREITGAPAFGRASSLVDPPDGLGVDAQPCTECEAPSVDAAGRDRPRSVVCESVRQLLGRLERITRETEGAGKNARASARHESQREVVAVDAVQRFVEAAVAREDDQRVGVTCSSCELDGMLRPLGAHRADVRNAHQRAFDRCGLLVRDLARERIDDQDRTLHGVAYPRIPSSRNE